MPKRPRIRRPYGVHLLIPYEVTFKIKEGQRAYEVMPQDGSQPYSPDPESIIRILDIPTSKIQHVSRIDQCSESIRLIDRS